MSALFILRSAAQGLEGSDEPSRLPPVRASLAAQGFSAERHFRWPGGCLGWLPTPGQPETASDWLIEPNGALACVGTLFFDGSTGPAALARLFAAFHRPADLAHLPLSGSFVAFLCKDGKAWLFGDPVGLVKIYRSADSTLFSTSWLACAENSGEAVLDRIGALDYILAGANHGERTPLAGVRIVDPAVAIDLQTGQPVTAYPAADWHPAAPFQRQDEALDECQHIMESTARAIGSAFPGGVHAALSGGFDSRLIVASLLATGNRPALHVYGRPADDDVTIAQSIARALALDLTPIDKSVLNAAQPALDAAQIQRNLAFFDGIPIDGIFDRGADRQTRIAQSAGGAVALNGGGGEVLRNFFYLHDRSFAAADIARVFYSNHPPAAVRRPQDLAAYRDYLAHAMEHQVGQQGLLPRPLVELLYPLFRCRFWMSRNNTLAARCGDFLTPLLEPRLVRAAARIPLAWKDYGGFEAALITRIHPALGQFPLAYGFTPAAGPDRRSRASLWLQHRRPPWLRASMAALKALRGQRSPPLAQLFPGLIPDSPWLDEVLDTTRLIDEGQVLRAATLAVAGRHLGIRRADG